MHTYTASAWGSVHSCILSALRREPRVLSILRMSRAPAPVLALPLSHTLPRPHYSNQTCLLTFHHNCTRLAICQCFPFPHRYPAAVCFSCQTQPWHGFLGYGGFFFFSSRECLSHSNPLPLFVCIQVSHIGSGASQTVSQPHLLHLYLTLS